MNTDSTDHKRAIQEYISERGEFDESLDKIKECLSRCSGTHGLLSVCVFFFLFLLGGKNLNVGTVCVVDASLRRYPPEYFRRNFSVRLL